MKGSVINVTTNIDQIELILSSLPYDEAIWCILKWWFQYKSRYMFKDVCFNLIRLTPKDLILTPLYSHSNGTIHPQWTSLFAMRTIFSIQTYNQHISSSDDFD
jgi:hypothetical protein